MSLVQNSVKRCLIISLHDFHVESLSRIRSQVDWLNSLGVKSTTILAVPDYHSKGVLHPEGQEAKFLREMIQAGHEVALHGYKHLRIRSKNKSVPKLSIRDFFFTRLYTANEAEFYDLKLDEATELLTLGKRVLIDCGVFPRGFVAPGWLISQEALEAVWRAGFEWTCLINEILGKGGTKERTRSFCWSTRSAWRVPVSVIWNRLLFTRNKKLSIPRITLHPADLEYHYIRKQVQDIIKFFLEKNYIPVSYGRFIELKNG
jgi:predicted deacetylase